MDQIEEVWKPCLGWEDRYEISNLGRVRSLLDCFLEQLPEPRLKKSYVGKSGYEVVSFYRNTKMYLVKVHRLVAQVFVENPNNSGTVNHKDCIKTNNLPNNLEWCTNLYNYKHARENNRFPKLYGEMLGNSIWVEQEVIDIKSDINRGLTTKELFLKYPKLNSKHVYLFRKNKTWSHLTIRVN